MCVFLHIAKWTSGLRFIFDVVFLDSSLRHTFVFEYSYNKMLNVYQSTVLHCHLFNKGLTVRSVLKFS